MAKLAFLKLNLLHKRKGFTFLALVCVSVLIAYGITLWVSFRFDTIAKNGLMNVSISSTGNNIGVLGSGVNLDTGATANLLEDPSFEPYSFSEALTVEAGDTKTMIVSNEEAQPGVYAEGFFVGADVRVTTTDETGVVLRKSGTISRYSPNQIGEFQKSPTIGDIPSDAKLNAYTTKENVTITVGEKGILIKDINTQSPTVQYTETSANFTGVTHNQTDFFACSSDGLVIRSADGKTWERWETPENSQLNAIAASETEVVAVGNNGMILTGFDGILFAKEIGFDENFTDITYGNGLFVAVTDRGSILYSSNGILWTKKIQTSTTSYTKIEYVDTLFALLTGSKEVEIYTDIRGTSAVTPNAMTGVVDVTIMSKSKILALQEDNKIYQSDDQGLTWEESRITPPQDANLIGAIGDEEILCSSMVVNSYISRLVTEIEMDSELKQGTYQAGDLCYLDIEYPVLPATYLDTLNSAAMQSKWEFYGQGEADKIIQEGAPNDGVGILRLNSLVSPTSALPYAVISQDIATAGAEGLLTPSTFYTFSMWIRQESGTAGAVKVWVSGSFDPIGIEFTNIGTKWKKVTFKFLVPPDISAEAAAAATFNIGTEEPGVFYFDKAYLGLTSENEETIPAAYKTALQTIDPLWIRLNCLDLGAKNAMPNRWAENGRLEESLNLVYETGANSNPWIVIDSFMGESELRNLLEYFAGSISTTYGRIRLENGSTLPWSGRFNKVLVEFVDTEGIFTGDISKAVYVNEMIEIIESSPYYEEIKNEVILVDGMEYEEGLMLSGADHSASDFKCKVAEDQYESILQSLSDYSAAIPRDADSPTSLPSNLMRSTDFNGIGEAGLTTSQLTTALLGKLGVEVNASLVSLQPWNTTAWSKAISSAAMIASKAGIGEALTVTKTQIGTNESRVDCYAYKSSDTLILVFASHNTGPVAISVDVAYSMEEAVLTRIDASGELVEELTLKVSDKRFNIMPDNVILIQVPIE